MKCNRCNKEIRRDDPIIPSSFGQFEHTVCPGEKCEKTIYSTKSGIIYNRRKENGRK